MIDIGSAIAAGFAIGVIVILTAIHTRPRWLGFRERSTVRRGLEDIRTELLESLRAMDEDEPEAASGSSREGGAFARTEPIRMVQETPENDARRGSDPSSSSVSEGRRAA